MAKKQAYTNSNCPCESDKPYEACCKPYHEGIAAPTAEALMRSRYTAYVLGLEEYLLQTWHADTRPAALNLHEDQAIKWLGLQVKKAQTNGAQTSDTRATVTFVARYKIGGKAERLVEISDFVLENGRWYYVMGQHPEN